MRWSGVGQGVRVEELGGYPSARAILIVTIVPWRIDGSPMSDFDYGPMAG